jgi:hypothetical protein
VTGISDETISIPSYAYTCAVCEVEVDPETGLRRGRPVCVGRRLRPSSQPRADPRPEPWGDRRKGLARRCRRHASTTRGPASCCRAR